MHPTPYAVLERLLVLSTANPAADDQDPWAYGTAAGFTKALPFSLKTTKRALAYLQGAGLVAVRTFQPKGGGRSWSRYTIRAAVLVAMAQERQAVPRYAPGHVHKPKQVQRSIPETFGVVASGDPDPPPAPDGSEAVEWIEREALKAVATG